MVTLKYGLEVTQGLKLVPFKSLGAVSYLPSTVATGMALSCIVCELQCDLLVGNSKICIPHLYLVPSKGSDPIGISRTI